MVLDFRPWMRKTPLFQRGPVDGVPWITRPGFLSDMSRFGGKAPIPRRGGPVAVPGEGQASQPVGPGKIRQGLVRFFKLAFHPALFLPPKSLLGKKLQFFPSRRLGRREISRREGRAEIIGGSREKGKRIHHIGTPG